MKLASSSLVWLILVAILPVFGGCAPPRPGPVLSACKRPMETQPFGRGWSIDAAEQVAPFFPPGMDRAKAVQILSAESFEVKPMKSETPEADEMLFSSKMFKIGRWAYATYECRLLIDIKDQRVSGFRAPIVRSNAIGRAALGC